MSKQTSSIGNSQWMLSFADLLSLILTFFVLIYSMAQPMQMTNFYKRDFDSLRNTESDINFSDIIIEKSDSFLSSEYLEDVFLAKKQQDNSFDSIGVSTELNRFVISIPQNQLTDELLEKISETIRIYENRKYVFSDRLEKSKQIVEKLIQNEVSQNIGYYQKQDVKDRIDIIIYM